MLQDSGQAGAYREIEVTPKMVDAALDEMRQNNFGGDMAYMAYMAECIYRAMAYACPAASANRDVR